MLDHLYRLTSRDGWEAPDGQYRMLAAPAGGLSWRRDGDDIHIQCQPPLQATRDDAFYGLIRGEVRQLKLSRSRLTIWVEGLPILGTVEREYDLAAVTDG